MLWYLQALGITWGSEEDPRVVLPSDREAYQKYILKQQDKGKGSYRGTRTCLYH